jgi:two-component system, OmpR family, KDP operon response regulator KdpE
MWCGVFFRDGNWDGAVHGVSEGVILAVDDEPSILRLLEIELTEQGFEVLKAHDAEEALSLAAERPPDVAVLDILMPGMQGTELITKLRELNNIAVIFLTARDKDTEIVFGLDLGADDYIVKPFNPEELTARIRAVMRRRAAGATIERVLNVGNLLIDLERRLVFRDGEPIELSANEWRLLRALAATPGKFIPSYDLLAKTWGAEYRSDMEYLRVWISRLRRKLEPDPEHPSVILTKPGVGYMLNADPI